MLAAIASAALIVAAALTVGQAVLTLCGRRDDRALAGPLGLALLLAVAGIVAGFDGRGGAIAIALGATLLAAACTLARTGLPAVGALPRITAIVASLAAGLFAALPFIAAGAVGILGVALVNDDMASHLLIADWIDERFRPEPVFIDQGYPLGPHALVAGLSTVLGARTIDVFAGLTLAIPALFAFAVATRLADLRPIARIGVAVLSALPYLAAAYLAQEAFKEPILALFVLAFALLLPARRSTSNATPLGLLAAGAVYVYSFPGLAWLVGTAVAYAVIVRAWEAGPGGARGNRFGIRASHSPRVHAAGFPPGTTRPVLALLAAIAAFAALIAPEVGRLIDFTDFRALDPDRANEGGLGNLGGHISPLEALGVWPASDFRVSASDASAPAVVFYAGALVAVAALALGLPRWLRRYGPAVPAALLTAAVLYVLARAFGTVYTSAKALAIAAPLLTVVSLGGLLGPRGWVSSNGGSAGEGLPDGGAPEDEGRIGRSSQEPRSTDATTVRGADAEAAPARAGQASLALTALAILVGVATAVSSFLVLRQAPVAPEEHMAELEEIRPIVAGEKLLFLGRDNFILWELRGSKPFTAVRNYYDPYYVQPNTELEDVFAKFDFDSVAAETLARFRYVLTTSAAYASSPPPGYRIVARTPSYVLYEKLRSPAGREPGEDDAAPGATGGCPAQRPRVVSVFESEPVLAAAWSDETVESDEIVTTTLEVPPGRWRLSLQYDATRPLTLTAEGFSFELPANLDYRGTVPFHDAGVVESDGQPLEVEATVERPPLAGRLLGAKAAAHLGSLAATRAGDPRPASPREDCSAYVDWYERR